jgi:hypothetical protein
MEPEEPRLTTQRSWARTPGTNPLPYEMNPDPKGVTPVGWSILTEAEARDYIANWSASPRRDTTSEDS